MLITNFSSGELSKTLFGRIDLPQYYSGAAKLENFDVIPTGGIKRRGGMKRLRELEAGGRLIPFIVNRDKSFLIYLSPGVVKVFKYQENELVEASNNLDSIETIKGNYSDGINWIAADMPGTYNDYITYLNGMFFADKYISDDGVNWTRWDMPPPTNSPFYSSSIKGVAYGNGIYVAVGSIGARGYSTDGVNWTDNSSSERNTLRSVAYGNGKFVAVGQHCGAVSTNGIDWTEGRMFPEDPSGGDFYKVVFANDVFVAVGNNGICALSTDGVSWTRGVTMRTDAFLINYAYDVAYGNGIFVAVTNRDAVFTSTNGLNWIPQLAPLGKARGITYANGVFVAVGQEGFSAVSVDGVSWIEGGEIERGEVNTTSTRWSYLDSVAYGNGKFVAVGSNITTVSVLPDIPSGSKLYQTLKEIEEVQYAQNYDEMVLCHENYPPIRVKAMGESLFFAPLIMDFEVEIIADKNITGYEIASIDNDKFDTQYISNGWLTSEGNYPSAVSYFSGRLIFASTKNNRQRVFASAIQTNEDKERGRYRFATKKIFLTQRREYSILFGEIDTHDTSIIDINSDYIPIFNKPQNHYYIDSPLYDSDTRIEYINLNQVKLTKQVSNSVVINDIVLILNILSQRILECEEIDKNPSVYQVYQRRYEYTWLHVGWQSYQRAEYEEYIDCKIYSNKIEIINRRRYKQGTNSSYSWENTQTVRSTIYAPKDAVKEIRNDANIYFNTLNTKINEVISVIQSNFISNTGYWEEENDQYTGVNTDNGGSINNNNITTAYDNYIKNINDTMSYSFGIPIEPYYEEVFDYPEELLERVRDRIQNSNKTYIPFYTKENIADEHPTPDCGFTFEIASDMSDAIRWLTVNKGIIVGTETSEWIIPPDIHATNVHAIMNSKNGSDKIQGTPVGDATCFFTSGRRSLVEFYPNENNHFRTNNMAMLATQVLHESPAKEFDYMAAPYTKLLVTREDGQMVTLLYDRSTGTFAWSRITTGEVTRDTVTPEEIEQARKAHHSKKLTYELSPGPFKPPKKLVRTVEGRIESAAVLPGKSGFDEIFLIVQRNGGFYLELLQEDGEVYLDSWREYNDDREGYTDDAIVHEGKIGYPYTSIITSMPIQANQKLKQTNIRNLNIRFSDSYMPYTRALPARVKNSIDRPEPNSAVVQSYFNGGWDKNLQFEIIHEKPTRCCILAVYAEAE